MTVKELIEKHEANWRKYLPEFNLGEDVILWPAGYSLPKSE